MKATINRLFFAITRNLDGPLMIAFAVLAAISLAVVFSASGGITLTTLRDVALTGVDCVSVGALTHSAPAADLSLTVLPARP